MSKFTGKTIVTKTLALLIVIVMTFADFAIIGADVISYAVDMVATNNNNVEFSAYFKQGDQPSTNIDSFINANSLKLFIEVSVKREGYFNGQITLEDSSFNLKNSSLSEYVSKIEGNTVILNQINAGTTAVIELEVEYANAEEIKLSSLSQENKIKLTGTYTDSKKDRKIEGQTNVTVNWKSNEEINAKIGAKLLANTIYEVNEVNKRVVQVLINSKLENNAYPVKSTDIQMNVPTGVEEVKVHKRTTTATNGNIEFNENNYTYNKENNTLTINIQNDEKDGIIKWNKNAQDTVIVTYIYPENINIENANLDINSLIRTYDNKDLTAETNVKISGNVDEIISSNIIEKDSEIYKGKIYTKEDKTYTTTTVLNVDFVGVTEKIELEEKQAVFISDEDLKTNIQYVETKINKKEFLGLFGEEGFITIVDQDNNIIANINKDSQTDENGNVIIRYNEGINKIVINTSTPQMIGMLNIEHTKVISDSKLSRKQIRSISNIEEEVDTKYIKFVGPSNENKTKQSIKLKETSSEANIKINKQKLSIITTNENVEIVATLETNSESKDLYKNPKIAIILPKEINGVRVKQAKALYRNGLNVSNYVQTKNENGNIVLNVEFSGEQEKYDSEILNGLEVHFYADIEVDKDIPSKDVAIKMKYTNQNGIEDVYEAETTLQLESQYGLMLYNKMAKYNAQNSEIETIDENKQEAKLDVNKSNVSAEVTTSLINNYDSSVKKIEIVGVNDFSANIKNIKVNNKNVKIYYNSNLDAVNNNKNWKQDNKNAKAYKIILDEVNPGEVATIAYNLDIKDNLSYNESGDLITNVNYVYGNKELTKTSNIELATESAAIEEKTEGVTSNLQGMQINVAAVSGNKELKNGDSVYEGETIKYTVSIKNNTENSYKNVTLKTVNTNGKILDLVGIEVTNHLIYDGDGTATEHYWRMTDSNEKEFKNINLEKGKTVTLEYQVVVQKGLETFGDIYISSETDSLKEKVTTPKYNIQDADLKMLFVPGVSEECYWTSDSVQQANLNVTNNTERDLKNVKVQIILSKELTFDIYKDNGYIDCNEGIKVDIKNKETNSLGQTIVTLNIEEIKAGAVAEIYVKPYIKDFKGDKENIEIYANAQTEEGKAYTSNNVIREVTQVKRLVEVNQIAKVNGKEASKDTKVVNGDNLEFDISIKNNDVNQATLNILDYIQKGINVKNIVVIDNNNKSTDITNQYNEQNLIYDFKLNPNEQVKIIILASVNTSYMKLENKITNKVNVSDIDSTAVYTSTTNLNVYIPEVDDGKFNIVATQESSVKNGSTVNNGSRMEFTIKVQNTGNFDRKVSVYDYINTSIKKLSISVDGKDVTKQYLKNNDVKVEDITVKANSSSNIKINGTVNLKGYSNETISNEAIIKSSIQDAKTNTITYNVAKVQTPQIPSNPDDPDESDDPSNPSNPQTPSNPTNPGSSTSDEPEYTVSGTAWIDKNENGKRDDNEDKMNDVVVRALNTKTKDVLTVSATTGEDGKYNITLPQGKYIIAFIYDNDNYNVTTYQARKVSDELNSDVVAKTLNIDNKDMVVGATDTIDLTSNIDNIDIGLVFRNKFDLKLEKFVSKIAVTNNGETKDYNFDDETLAKIEIAAKHLSSSTVVVEYKIKVTNIGDVEGYAKKIRDYMPEGFKFSSSLNKDWYQSGDSLYNESLENTKIGVGESKEISLVLTKKMTESNTGLTNNTASIQSYYNSKSFSDINSDNNKGLADVIISVKTGTAIKLALFTISLTVAIAGISYYVTKKYVDKKF